ncbi:MAG TPA: hypothetical protein VK588_09955 [Chitinophagaceae bacterium]|nr:hypothetical protein [Chitinophagaceae bacterium]
MFHTQGRWLSGLIFQNCFSSILTIGQLKILRLISLGGWVATTIAWAIFFKKWSYWLNLDEKTWWLSSIYIVCSISVCIYIGWASCFEIFLAIFFGLLSTHILFKGLNKNQHEIHLSNMVILGSVLAGLASLFLYQPAFGIFLLPFFLAYVKNKKARPTRVIIIGMIFYISLYLIYYILFKYSLRSYHLEASNRTEIHFNFLKKLSFFFSGPFPQGFSMNLLFSASSIFSQIFYPLVFIGWLWITLKRNQHLTFGGNVVFVAIILFLLALIYLPSMISAEDFPSYRTLFVFNLSVFIMVIESFLQLFSSEKKKTIVTIAGVLFLVMTSVYTFNFQFVNPLKKEYSVLKKFLRENYDPSITHVHFIRADKFLFTPEFHTRVYRDEFGAPSTYRDWVPEPIVKQMIFELTNDRKLAEKITVIQFDAQSSFDLAEKISKDSNSLLINMNRLFEQK